MYPSANKCGILHPSIHPSIYPSIHISYYVLNKAPSMDEVKFWTTLYRPYRYIKIVPRIVFLNFFSQKIYPKLPKYPHHHRPRQVDTLPPPPPPIVGRIFGTRTGTWRLSGRFLGFTTTIFTQMSRPGSGM
jgi:hypothetical protein